LHREEERARRRGARAIVLVAVNLFARHFSEKSASPIAARSRARLAAIERDDDDDLARPPDLSRSRPRGGARVSRRARPRATSAREGLDLSGGGEGRKTRPFAVAVWDKSTTTRRVRDDSRE
jgi:hypothetical protein